MSGGANIRERLFALGDERYARFQSALIPNIPKETVIGVRMPMMRKLAKEIAGAEEMRPFLAELPHAYYDENILHSVLLSQMKDYGMCMGAVEAFLPHIDNWAVCDCLSPKAFVRHKPELLENIREWAKSEHVYTCRFGLEMLMTHFLDDDFKPEYLELAADVKLEDYYAKMMVAWFFATALAKQWDAAIVYLQQNRLEPWTHNKTIQKARESYRITAEQKEYLKTLKRTPSVTTSSCHLPRRGRQ